MDDSSGDEISGSNYLTSSQFEEIFTNWSEGDKPENDCIQSDIEVDGNGLDMDCSESDEAENDSKQSDIEIDGNGLDIDCSESDKPERKSKSSDSCLYS